MDSMSWVMRQISRRAFPLGIGLFSVSGHPARSRRSDRVFCVLFGCSSLATVGLHLGLHGLDLLSGGGPFWRYAFFPHLGLHFVTANVWL